MGPGRVRGVHTAFVRRLSPPRSSIVGCGSGANHCRLMARPPPSVLHDLLGAQHGVVTRAQLIGVGVSDRVTARLVRDGTLQRLHPGAYAAAASFRAADERVQHCMRLFALQLGAPDAAAYAQSGATVWGLPVRRVPVRPMLLREVTRPRLHGACVRRSRAMADHLTRHAGLVVTTIAKTVVDVAAEVPFADALITVDAALRRGVSSDELRDVCSSAPPVRGVAAARRALAAGDPYSESWLESLSRGRMIERGLALPLCNVVLRTHGRWVRVDFLRAELGVVGEADGSGKYQESDDPGRTVLRERDRQRWVEDHGFEVARWGTPDVADDGSVMARRLERSITRQEVRGFTWPAAVQAEVPLLGRVPPPERVVREVHRLAALGFPITFTDARNRPVNVTLPTPAD